MLCQLMESSLQYGFILTDQQFLSWSSVFTQSFDVAYTLSREILEGIFEIALYRLDRVELRRQ